MREAHELHEPRKTYLELELSQTGTTLSASYKTKNGETYMNGASRAEASIAVVDNAWHTVEMRYDGANVVLLVDGWDGKYSRGPYIYMFAPECQYIVRVCMLA